VRCQVSNDMYLYVIECVGVDLVKIGYSADPDHRLTELQTGNANKLRVAHRVSVDPGRERVLEQRVHQELSYRRVRGEWFKMSADQARGVLDHAIIRWHDDPLI